jgi:Lsr2
VTAGEPQATAFVTDRGLCHHLRMAKTVIVKLTDDIDGGDADETIEFALDGRAYEVDLSSANASKLRDALKPYIEKGRAGNGGRTRASRRSGPPAEETLYSQLSYDEKSRFRAWAHMPTARRISDARVKSWTGAGKP